MVLSYMDIWNSLMKQEKIDKLLKDRDIRTKERNPAEVRSIINASIQVARFATSLKITENNATIIFRELYESIRQLGDALWLGEGYEAQTHEATITILKELDIPHKVKLNFLDRYKKIRHDSNYRGILASVDQAKEIVGFWKTCSEEIIDKIEEKLKEKPKPIQ